MAINEEHVPLAGEETGLEQVLSQPMAGMSAGLCNYLLLAPGFCFGGLQHLREALLKRLCALGASTECGHAQEPRARRETQNDS